VLVLHTPLHDVSFSVSFDNNISFLNLIHHLRILALTVDLRKLDRVPHRARCLASGGYSGSLSQIGDSTGDGPGNPVCLHDCNGSGRLLARCRLSLVGLLLLSGIDGGLRVAGTTYNASRARLAVWCRALVGDWVAAGECGKRSVDVLRERVGGCALCYVHACVEGYASAIAYVVGGTGCGAAKKIVHDTGLPAIVLSLLVTT